MIMKVGIFLFLMISNLSCNTVFAQETGAINDEESIKEAVWKVVELRNSTWAENDFQGHMAIYHPEFRRWTLHSNELMTKDIFASFWEGIKSNEEVLEIDVERKEMQILDDGKLAVAHYTINEDYEWIGENRITSDGITVRKGQTFNGKLRFSDYYLKVGQEWQYIGGHRDGAYLEEN